MKFTLLFLGLITCVELYAQLPDNSREGFSDNNKLQREKSIFYIGVGLGPCFFINPKPEYSNAGAGLNLNLINFNFITKKKYGLTLNWLGAAHNFTNTMSPRVAQVLIL